MNIRVIGEDKMGNLTISELISRAKIQIQNKNSFWAYLALYLKFQEIEKGKMRNDTMGVDPDGNIHYVKEFIESLTKNDDTQLLEGLIIHELNHLVFLTEMRRENRDLDGWNIASDIAINTLLRNNGFKLPEGGAWANSNDEFVDKQGKVLVKDVSKKTAEEIYDKLPTVKMKQNVYVIASGSGKGNELGKAFDNHLKGKGEKKGGLSQKEKEELRKKWEEKIQEAIIVSKLKGDILRGLERLWEKLQESKIDWRTLLNRYITNQLPYNFSYHRPHKKSVSCGVYLPTVLKEKVDVVIGIDVSGSIGQEELSEFLSEIISIAKAYQDRISMKLITHETSVNDIFDIENGSIDKIKALKLHGGGGTSHKDIFKYIGENVRDCKCCIFLTDGYSDIDSIKFEEYSFDKLFVISTGGYDEQLKGKNCKIIEGDWILCKDGNPKEMKGNFIVGKVEQLRIIYDEAYFFKGDMMRFKKDCGSKINKYMYAVVLNKNDLKNFNLIKKKMEMLDNLK